MRAYYTTENTDMRALLYLYSLNIMRVLCCRRRSRIARALFCPLLSHLHAPAAAARACSAEYFFDVVVVVVVVLNGLTRGN